MKKIALILHGWPQPVEPGSMNYPYHQYFQKKGYNVIAPNLFTDDFILKEAEAKGYTENLLNDKKPDVIVGISMGGLIVPLIAEKYPDAKLIFIASNPKLGLESHIHSLLLIISTNKILLYLVYLSKFLPHFALEAIYKSINPFSGNSHQKKIYIDDMNKNLKYMFSISLSKYSEIINFVISTNNTKILRKLSNKSLIFQSLNDLMMPSTSKSSLMSLLKNSTVIKTKGGHFDVFTDKNFADIDKFL